jgi:ATP-dependent RNA helicase DDX56/DBP9
MSYFLDDEKTWVQRDFGMDRRLVKALSKLGFTYPTLVQAKCIPIAMQGKDVLVRAKTGSGKTIAFSLPVLQKILSLKDSKQGSGQQSIKCIVLAPTKELIKQIEKHMTDLIYYCRESITICSLADDNTSVQKFRLQSKPDVVISTPARLVQNLKSFEIDLSNVTTLVMDEADLVLSFGYTEDVHTIIQQMPKIFQGILMSATLSAELDKFKRVVLHNPALLKLEEPEGATNLMQFFLKCTEKDKFLVLYVFIKLGLLQVRYNSPVFCFSVLVAYICLDVNTAGQGPDLRERREQVLQAEAVLPAVFHQHGGAERRGAAQLSPAHPGGKVAANDVIIMCELLRTPREQF